MKTKYTVFWLSCLALLTFLSFTLQASSWGRSNSAVNREINFDTEAKGSEKLYTKCEYFPISPFSVNIVAYTKSRRFVSEAGLEVTLFGAYHFGTSAFYQLLKEDLERYEVVLYEFGGGPANTRVSGEMKNACLYGWHAQNAFILMGTGISYEGHEVDKGRIKNFEWSDLPKKDGKYVTDLKEAEPSEEINCTDRIYKLYKKSFDKFYETELTNEKFYHLFETAMSALSEDSDILRKKEQVGSLCRLKYGQSDIEDKELIYMRNERIKEKLSEAIKDGKKSIAILWGAAHQPDLEEHLLKALSMTPEEETWYEVGQCQERP